MSLVGVVEGEVKPKQARPSICSNILCTVEYSTIHTIHYCDLLTSRSPYGNMELSFVIHPSRTRETQIGIKMFEPGFRIDRNEKPPPQNPNYRPANSRVAPDNRITPPLSRDSNVEPILKPSGFSKYIELIPTMNRTGLPGLFGRPMAGKKCRIMPSFFSRSQKSLGVRKGRIFL